MEKDKALHYNEQVEKHAQSGKVDKAAQKAKEALNDQKQSKELKEAEEHGKNARH